MLSGLLSVPKVQTRLGREVTNYLNESFDINAKIGSVDLSVFGDVKFRNIEVLDHHLDSMIFVGRLEMSIINYENIFKNNLVFGNIELEKVVFIMRTHKNEENSAFNQFVDKFKGEEDVSGSTALDTVPSNFSMKSNMITINDGYFKSYDDNKPNPIVVSIDHIDGEVHDFLIKGSLVHADLQGVRFVDNHNIKIVYFNSDFTYTPEEMFFKNTLIQSETSKVAANFSFISSDLYSDFTNKVGIKAEIKNSDLSMRDLNKFYGETGREDVLHFSSNITGTLNNFKATNFHLKSDLNTTLEGDFEVKNAFNTKNGFAIEGQNLNLITDYNRLDVLLPNKVFYSIPPLINTLGQFKVIGSLEFSNEIIDTSVLIYTDIGSVISDITISTDDGIFDNASYKGHLKINDFNLGKIFNDPLIGEISMDIDVDGYGFKLENVSTIVIGDVYSYYYKDYKYENIIINGRFQNRKFEGELRVDDENLKLNFNGLADLSQEVHKYDFEANVLYSDFNKLNLFKRDSIVILKGNIDIDLEGNTLEDLVGTINFDKASFTNEHENFYFENFDVRASYENGVKRVAINSSDIIEGEITGNFKFVEIPKLVKNALGSIYSNYESVKTEKGQFMKFNFDIHNKIVGVFLPGVRFSSNTSVSGLVDSDTNDLELKVRAPQVAAGSTIIDNVLINIDNRAPLFSTQISIDSIVAKNYKLSKINLVNRTLNDTLFFRTEFVGGKDELDLYNIGFYYTIDADRKSVFGINKSEIKFKETIWELNPTNNKKNKVVFDLGEKNYELEQFEMISGDQEIAFRGSMFGDTEKDLNVIVKNVNLEGVTPNISDWKFQGLINGKFQYLQNEDRIKPVVNLQIEDFQVNDYYQGNIDMSMEGRNSSEIYNVNLSMEKEYINTLFAYGVLNFAIDEPDIDLAIEFEQFDLGVINAIGKGVFDKMRGELYGNARITGLLKNPNMDGSFYMFDAGMSLPYLDVNYDFEGTSIIDLHDQTFEFVDFTLADTEERTKGNLRGSISHKFFEKWKLDLNLRTDNLLILNTKQEEESIYFGKGYMNGQARITGATDNLTINVNAKTNKGTLFVVPISSSKSVSEGGIVSFVDFNKQKDSVVFTKEDRFDKIKGLALNFDLEITQDAKFEMVLDDDGSMLEGSGNGNLLIELDSHGKFNMYGDLTVERGAYNFIYREIISKKFIAKPGGTISWNGDPMGAIIDIETVNRVKANPKYLLESVNTSRDIPIDLVTKFSGELYNSKQEYDVLIPDADSEIKAELDFKLNGNDMNSKMNNFGSLLLFGTFSSEENTVGDNSKMMMAGIGADFLSKALTNIVNTGNSNVKLGVTYDIGDPRSNIESLQTYDQVGITLETKVNDRILIDGKIGVPVGTSGTSENQTGMVGEVEVEFLLNEEGTLRSNVFNRQNEIQYTEEEEGYTQGVGISYRFDFNSLSDFLEKIGLKETEKKDSLNNLEKEAVPLKQPLVNTD
ncbi:MAG: translocation/assembly module TamB [Flavobacteriaceae bacterium]|nr:translocation/assembly module TamB [Flavobacteriaceae bacterium]